MPKFQNIQGDMDTFAMGGGSTFQFSGAKISNLGATEYTLATIIVDGSGSVSAFWSRICASVTEAVKALVGTKQRPNPRADNTMLRVVIFDNGLHEVHGFRPLPDCNVSDYIALSQPGGSTALYDATFTGVKATTEYARQLQASQYTSNGIVIVITDGAEYPSNASKATRKMIADAITEARTGEALESIVPILVGVNTSVGSLNTYLDEFQREAGFQQYVSLEDANNDNLGKLGGFISRSISSQSQALGTGGPSQSIVF